MSAGLLVAIGPDVRLVGVPTLNATDRIVLIEAIAVADGLSDDAARAVLQFAAPHLTGNAQWDAWEEARDAIRNRGPELAADLADPDYQDCADRAEIAVMRLVHGHRTGGGWAA
jgi:hypothetical protein